ncbi:hypothetical protein [Gluconobacter kondonii]|uniref:hypothetical protein n=1 Tax=Gluconobacter kondonii TaxID=941463 RepID=UPI001B8CD642|nr:hypothetical protein [Gluconobacter kondonii]MBS1058319.1 hypothetical protein [Gluconobacter kondonii]
MIALSNLAWTITYDDGHKNDVPGLLSRIEIEERFLGELKMHANSACSYCPIKAEGFWGQKSCEIISKEEIENLLSLL